jgi:molybdopterin/thiamine biosynthesis adenylyltransferase
MIAMADEDLGGSALESGVRGLERVNQDLEIDAWPEDVESVERALELVEGVDLVLSSPPSSEQRMHLNAACVRAGVPLLEAAMHGWLGQVFLAVPGRTACLACLAPEPPPLRRPFPVLGATSGFVACLAAVEAVRFLARLPGRREGVLLRLDLESARMENLRVPRRPGCAVCG